MKDLTKENLDGIRCDEEKDKTNSRPSQRKWSSLNTMGLHGVVNASYSPTIQKLRFRNNGSSVEANNYIWEFNENQWRLTFGDGEETRLLYTKHEKIALQDFDGEVRPAVDVEQFLGSDCALILGEDVAAQNYSSLVDLVTLLLGTVVG